MFMITQRQLLETDVLIIIIKDQYGSMSLSENCCCICVKTVAGVIVDVFVLLRVRQSAGAREHCSKAASHFVGRRGKSKERKRGKQGQNSKKQKAKRKKKCQKEE